MIKRRTISKVLLVSIWLLVAAGITTLLLASKKKSEAQICKGVSIKITPDSDQHYIAEDEVLFTIEKKAQTALTGSALTHINLQELEKALKENNWVRDAQLYIDSKNVLHVTVAERKPIARFMNTAGNSFYVDEEGKQLAFIAEKPIRLPVITGFTYAKKWSARDSAIYEQANEIVRYVAADKFWNSQIGQIDITINGSFELIPMIGDHLIRVGSAENIGDKLRSLFLFYQQVLTKTGFNKYTVLDLQYDGQIVAVKKGNESAVDSVQLKKSIEAFLAAKRQQQEVDSVTMATPARELASETEFSKSKETEHISKIDSRPETDRPNTLEKPLPLPLSVPVKTKPSPIQTEKPKEQIKTTVVKKEENTKLQAKQPKAVMQPHDQKENEY